MRDSSFVLAGLVVVLVAPVSLFAADPTGNTSVVVETPNLIAFWTFGEPGGQPRDSITTGAKYPLQEVGGPIARVDGGPYSGYSAYFDGSQYMKLPYEKTGRLNINGPDAQVSMFAVVRISNLKKSRTIAGMWCEGKGANDDSGTRQYALLMNMPAYGGRNQLVPHISSEGGVTRRSDGTPFPWCCDYAASVSEVPVDRWCSLGFTYDAKYIRAYVDGRFEPRPLDPVKDRRNDPYFLSEGPKGRDRGMNPYYHGRGIFRYDPAKHAATKMPPSDFTVAARFAVGSITRRATIGRFGGLAVFDRALTDAEMKALHESANINGLK
jgi:hypothetical protein